MDRALQRELKAQAHHLKAVATVGNKGLTESVIKEIDEQLNCHELLKVKIVAPRDARQGIADEICTALHAELVNIIGQVAILYRKKADS